MESVACRAAAAGWLIWWWSCLSRNEELSNDSNLGDSDLAYANLFSLLTVDSEMTCQLRKRQALRGMNVSTTRSTSTLRNVMVISLLVFACRHVDTTRVETVDEWLARDACAELDGGLLGQLLDGSGCLMECESARLKRVNPDGGTCSTPAPMAPERESTLRWEFDCRKGRAPADIMRGGCGARCVNGHSELFELDAGACFWLHVSPGESNAI